MKLMSLPISAYLYSLIVSVILGMIGEVVYTFVYHFNLTTSSRQAMKGNHGVVDWDKFFQLGVPSGVTMAFLGFSIAATYFLVGANEKSHASLMLLLVEALIWLLAAYVWRTVVSKRVEAIVEVFQNPKVKLSYKSKFSGRMLYPLGAFAFFLSVLWGMG